MKMELPPLTVHHRNGFATEYNNKIVRGSLPLQSRKAGVIEYEQNSAPWLPDSVIIRGNNGDEEHIPEVWIESTLRNFLMVRNAYRTLYQGIVSNGETHIAQFHQEGALIDNWVLSYTVTSRGEVKNAELQFRECTIVTERVKLRGSIDSTGHEVFLKGRNFYGNPIPIKSRLLVSLKYINRRAYEMNGR